MYAQVPGRKHEHGVSREGDLIILSNHPKLTLYSEIRDGKIGGMAATIKSLFIEYSSDHNAMLTPTN